MAKGKGLQFQTTVDISQSKARLLELKRLISEVGGISMSGGNSANFTAAQAAMTRTMRASLLETERLRQEGVRLRNEYESGRISAQQLAAQTRALNEQRRQEAAALRAARTVQTAANGSYQEAQNRLRQLSVQIRSVEGGFSGLGRVQQARIAEYRRLNDSLTEFDRRMGNNQRNVGNYSSAISGVKGQLTGLITTYVSAAAAIGLVTSAFSQSLKSSAVRTSLEFTFGSVDLADAKLEQLLDTANRLGVNYNALTSSYKSFTGAVVASNFDFQEGERIFNAVAGASSKLKLSSEDTEGALRALQQMISKGNVQAEELRGQLGERIPGAFSIAARAIGVTETQLNKMLQKGEVLAADLLPKLATELEKTFGLESTTAVEGLNAETERFFNMFSGAVAESSNINKFFANVVGGFNEIFGTIFKMVNSDTWGEFWTRLIDGAGPAEAIKNIGKSYDQASKAIKNSLNITAGDSKKALFALEEVRIGYDKATKALEQYKAGVKDGSLKDGGDVTISALENTVKVAEARLKALEKLQPAKKSVVIGETASEKAARLKAEREAERELNAQRILQKKITDLKNEANRKTLTKDEEEVQTVRDKFSKIAEEIRLFNANPKNKLKVDGSGLEPAMKAQIVSIEYKQDTDKLKESLEVQKGLYEQYESYRTELGKKAADDRFGAEIDTTKKYGDVLQAEYSKVLEQGSKTGFTGAMTERMKVLEKQIREEGVVENKRQDDLMKSIISFDNEVKSLNEKYEQDRIDVLAKGGGKDLEVLTKNHNLKLAALGDAHLKEIDAFKELYNGIDRLSDQNARKVIGNAEDALKALKAKGVVISKELEAELKRLFADSKLAIADRLPERLIALANQISNVASSVSGVDENFGKVLGTVGNIVGQVGNIKKGLLDFNKPGATGLEKLTAGLGIFSSGVGIFSAGISGIKTISNLFGDLKAGAEQQAYAMELQNKQSDALNKSLQRQIELLDDVYGTKRIAEYEIARKKAEENRLQYLSDLSGKYLRTGDKQTDEIIKVLNEGGSLPGMSREFVDKVLGNAGAKKVGDLSKLTLRQLKDLSDSINIDEITSKTLANLIESVQAAQDLDNALAADRIGAGLDTIVDEFMTNLEDGVGGIEDVLTKAIRRGLLNSLKGDITDKFLQDYYTMLDKALTDGNISADEDALLREQLKKADEYGKARLDYINKAAPEVASGASSATLAGAIQAITQTQADKLVGVFTGVQVATIKTNAAIGVSNDWLGRTYSLLTDNLRSIQANTLRTANNTDRLQAMEGYLSTLVRKADDNKNALGGSGRPVI